MEVVKIFFFISISSSSLASTAICTRYLCRNNTVDNEESYHSYFGGNVVEDSILNVPVALSNVTVKSKGACVRTCTHADGCYSVNAGPIENEVIECQLLKENPYSNGSLIISKPGWNHISLKNTGCESSPCKSNGTCVPNYEDDTYFCECIDPSLYGHRCGKIVEVLKPKAEWNFTFDTNAENVGTESMSVSLSSGTIVHVPGRKTKVLFCPGTSVCVPTYHSNPLTGGPLAICLYDSTPSACSKGVTITLWVKIPRNEGERLKTLGTERSYIMKKPDAIFTNLYYTRNNEKWVMYWKSSTHTAKNEFSGNNINQWHHLAFVYDYPKAMGYLDGELQSNVTFTEASVGGQSIFQLFSTSSSIHPSFYIDEFKIWLLSHDEKEIKEFYQQEKDN